MRQALCIVPLIVSLAACSPKEFGPVSTPSAEHPVYARAYPERVTSSIQGLDADRAAAKEATVKIQSFPKELKEPDLNEVARIYELAQADGKSAHYAKVRQENADIEVFFTDEKKELTKKISGAVQYQAKQDNCNSQLHGAVDYGYEQGLSERLKKREEAYSQAQLYIVQNKEKLGAANAKVLSEQAQVIAATAHLVYVVLAEDHEELSRLVEEDGAVKKTLSRRLDELEASRRPDESKEEKAELDKEHEEIFTVRAELEAPVKAGKERLKTSEQEVTDARTAFEQAMKSLLEDVRKPKA